MDPSQIGLLVVLIVLVLMSAFFSATETAFTSVSRVRLHTLEANGVRWAKRAGKMIDNYDKLITTVLIGNNIVNIVLTSLATVFFVALMTKNQSMAVTVSTAVTTLVVLIFGEITPKTIAKEHPEGFVRAVCGIVWFLEILFFPLTWIFSQWRKLLLKIFKFKKAPGITEDELLTYVETAHSEGGIDEHESELIRSAIEFEDLDVGDIMVHRVGVVAVSDTATMDEVAAAFRENGYSRIPVYSGTIDTVIGIVHEKDFLTTLLDGADNFKSCIQNTVCLSANMKISAALRMMQKGKIHMAIVVDEYGGTSGIITMEDILEELVGEIYDEHDEIEEFIKRTGENVYVINGNAPLNDAFDYMGVDLKESFESSSVGGWVTEQMEKIPVAGESFEYNNLRIVVTRSTPKRVAEVQITVGETEDEYRREPRKKRPRKNMQDIALRIITAAAVTAALVLYLYESGARRIVDIVIAAVAFAATLPLFAALAAASSLVNMRVFDRTDGGLTFSYPQGALRKLPFLLSVLSGKRHILPIKLFGKKKKETLPI